MDPEETTWSYWNVYFDCFFPLGFGHPLWHPFGQEGEVLVGDVGWIQKGKFRPLFNSMRNEYHAAHFVRGVPRDFQPITREAKILIGHEVGDPFWGDVTPTGDTLRAIDLRPNRRFTTPW